MYQPDSKKSPVEKFEWRQLQFARAKLKTAVNNGGFFAGFGIVAIVELQIRDNKTNPIPTPLLIFYGIITVSFICIHLTSLMMASCLLPYVDMIAESEMDDINTIRDSPHVRFHRSIVIGWWMSNMIGPGMFFILIVTIFWTKFWELGDWSKDKPGKQMAFYSCITLAIYVPLLLATVVVLRRRLHDFSRIRLLRSKRYSAIRIKKCRIEDSYI